MPALATTLAVKAMEATLSSNATTPAAVSVLEQSCGVLVHMARSDPGAQAVVTAGGVVTLVGTLQQYGAHGPLASTVISLLQALARKSSSHRAAIVAAGGIPALVSTFQLHADAEMAHATSMLLGWLGMDAPHRPLLVAGSAIPSLVGALRRHPNDAGVVLEASAALRWLATDNLVNQAAVAAEGAMPLLVVALQEHAANAEALARILDALVALADDPDRRVELASLRCMTHAMTALRRHARHPGVARFATYLSWRLHHNTDNAAALIAADGIPLMVDMLRNHLAEATIVYVAGHVLRSLASASAAHKAAINAAGGVPALKAALAAYASDEETSGGIRGALQLLGQ